MADSRVKNLPNATALTATPAGQVGPLDLLLFERYLSGGDGAVPANNTYEADSMFVRDFLKASIISDENRLLNGEFLFDQINEYAAVTGIAAGTSLSDGWSIANANSYAAVFSAQNVSDAPPGHTRSYLLTCTSAAAPSASQLAAFFTVVEGNDMSDLNFGTANAKSVVFSFWAKSSLTGSFTATLINPAATRAYNVSYTIGVANTWTYFSFVVTGDTGGSWVGAGTAGSLQARFDLGAGSTYITSSANTWLAGAFLAITGSQVFGNHGSATLNIAAVRLRTGTFDIGYTPSPYPVEKSRILRNYQKSFMPGTAPINALGDKTNAFHFTLPYSFATASHYKLWLPFSTPMRVGATITFYNPINNNGNAYNVTRAADGGSCGATDVGVTGMEVDYALNASDVVGNEVCVHWTANARTGLG